jgi:hypothetical protein
VKKDLRLLESSGYSFLPRIVSWQTKETIDCAVEIADLFFG